MLYCRNPSVIQKLLADTEICLDWVETDMMQANPGKFHFMLTGNHETQLMLHEESWV